MILKSIAFGELGNKYPALPGIESARCRKKQASSKRETVIARLYERP